MEKLPHMCQGIPEMIGNFLVFVNIRTQKIIIFSKFNVQTLIKKNNYGNPSEYLG